MPEATQTYQADFHLRNHNTWWVKLTWVLSVLPFLYIFQVNILEWGANREVRELTKDGKRGSKGKSLCMCGLHFRKERRPWFRWIWVKKYHASLKLSGHNMGQLLGAQVLGLAGSPWGSPQPGFSHLLHQGTRMDGVVTNQGSLHSLLGNVLRDEYVLISPLFNIPIRLISPPHLFWYPQRDANEVLIPKTIPL